MTIDEFQKVDLRVGKIVAAERIPNSEKLVKMQVDLGNADPGGVSGIRQVLAGVGKAYAPEDLIGKEIIVVANLEPRMLMGEESRGMLLAASDAEGIPVILTVEKPVPPGTIIK